MKSEWFNPSHEVATLRIRTDVATWLKAMNPWSLESQATTEPLSLHGIQFRLDLLLRAYQLAEVVKAPLDPWLNYIQEYTQEIHDRKETIGPWEGFHFRRSWVRALAQIHPLAAVEQSRVLVSALVGVTRNDGEADLSYKGLVPCTLQNTLFTPRSEAAIAPYLHEATATAVVGQFKIGENQRAVGLFEEIFLEARIDNGVLPAYKAYIDYCERTGNKKRLKGIIDRLEANPCDSPEQEIQIKTIKTWIEWSTTSIEFVSGKQQWAIEKCLRWSDVTQTISWLTLKLTEAMEDPIKNDDDIRLVHLVLVEYLTIISSEDLELGCGYILDVVNAISRSGSGWEQLGIDYLEIVNSTDWINLLDEVSDEDMFGEYIAEYVRLLGETGEGTHIFDLLYTWTQTHAEPWCDYIWHALVWAYAGQGKLEAASYIINHYIVDPEIKIDAWINYYALGLEYGLLNLRDYPNWIKMMKSEMDALSATHMVYEDEMDDGYEVDPEAEEITAEEYFGLSPMEQLWAVFLEFSIASGDYQQFSVLFTRLPLTTEKKIWLMHDLLVNDIAG